MDVPEADGVYRCQNGSLDTLTTQLQDADLIFNVLTSGEALLLVPNSFLLSKSYRECRSGGEVSGTVIEDYF